FERRKTDISPQAAKLLAGDVVPAVGAVLRRNSSPPSRGIPPTPLMHPHPARPVFRAAPTMKHTNQETASPIEHLPRLQKYPLPPLAVKKQSVPLVSPHPMHPMEKKTPLHLSSLKNGFGHKMPSDKSASPENLQGLREALASALHKDIDALKKEEKNKTPTQDTKQRSVGKEVPEDVLKKILHMDAE
ncbi:MAG: hypothetical protein HZC03_01595, partial [Candidatus Lloydbacteria bacterium]|nr:hypothetical protein [Candidatus Lloydbacteria bacterium]